MATIPLPILAGSIPFFFVALFLFGLLMGGLDVVGNVQAAEVEALRGKPTMSSFHAFYSIGGLGGALVGALLIANGWGDGTGAAGVCVILLALGAMAAGNLLPSERPIEGTPRFALPNRAVLGLGILAFLCFAVEGAVTDWSALFLTDAKAATPETAAYGYAAYAFAMAGFRLFGDPVVVRLGPKAITVGGSLLCVLGLGIVLAAPLAPRQRARLRPRSASARPTSCRSCSRPQRARRTSTPASESRPWLLSAIRDSWCSRPSSGSPPTCSASPRRSASCSLCRPRWRGLAAARSSTSRVRSEV